MIRSRALLFVLPVAAAIAFGFGSDAHADDPDQGLAKERCATRLSLALLGESPSEELLSATNPQAEVSKLLSLPSFRERFAKFVNAAHNRTPGDEPGADTSYWMARHILEKDLPWKDVFVGKLNLEQGEEEETPKVVADAKGLGYFHSFAWQERYEGNEKEGLRLTAAYRIANNVVGLTLSAVTNDPLADTSAKGRTQQPCASCHQDGWFPLDKVATIMPRVNLEADDFELVPATGGPQEMLDGVKVANEDELVNALVDSDAFRFYQCRLVFRFLYGRDENQCEGTIFDGCMKAFTESGKIQSGIEAVATHASFCQ